VQENEVPKIKKNCFGQLPAFLLIVMLESAGIGQAMSLTECRKTR